MSSQTVFLESGSTNVTIDVGPLLQDNSGSNPGDPLTGLVYNSASLVCYYREGATGSATALTLASQTVGGAHTDGGFVEISSGNMPGMYRLDLSDIMCDGGVGTRTTVVLAGYADLAAHAIFILFSPPVDITHINQTAIAGDGSTTPFGP